MGKLITLTGYDGAGKSTQVNYLLKHYRSKNKKVHATEAMFGYFLLKPVIKNLRRKTGSPTGGPVKRNSDFLPKLWFVPAFIDIWLMHVFKIKPLLRKYDAVIADRYYYDIWANLLYYGYITEWGYNSLLKFLPHPDIRIMLVADPESILKREREFPPAYYKSQAKIYKRLAQKLKFVEVDATKTAVTVAKHIKKTVNEEN